MNVGQLLSALCLMWIIHIILAEPCVKYEPLNEHGVGFDTIMPTAPAPTQSRHRGESGSYVYYNIINKISKGFYVRI